jgi:hypothetical protein
MVSLAPPGCAALIQNVDATLKSWPEGCRAILLAGAKRNVSNNTWWQDVLASVDASDGTGAVDALEATNIAKQRRSQNASGTGRGWDVGTLRSSDIGSNRRTTFSYFVTLGRSFFSPRKVKVALAWDSKITTLNILGIELLLGSTLAIDLDLQIFDSRGVQVGYSGSWDTQLRDCGVRRQPGRDLHHRDPALVRTEDVWYGIAWTVTGGLFWADVTRATVLERAIARWGASNPSSAESPSARSRGRDAGDRGVRPFDGTLIGLLQGQQPTARGRDHQGLALDDPALLRAGGGKSAIVDGLPPGPLTYLILGEVGRWP